MNIDTKVQIDQDEYIQFYIHPQGTTNAPINIEEDLTSQTHLLRLHHKETRHYRYRVDRIYFRILLYRLAIHQLPVNP